MWTKEFWKSTLERVIRGGIAALGGALVAGDWVFDVFNLNSIQDGVAVFAGGALTSFIMAFLGGQFGSGNGPSFTGVEVLDPNGPKPPPPVGAITLPQALIIAVVVGVVLAWLFGAWGPMPLK